MKRWIWTAVGIACLYLLISTNAGRGFQPTECVHWHTGLVETPPSGNAPGGDYDVGDVCDRYVKTGPKHWFEPFG
jgi:hypothetical protein